MLNNRDYKETGTIMFKKLFKNQDGATAIEYGLIAALIAVAAIAAMSSLGGNLSNTFNKVNNKLK
jgi:pilus assembly protein Flp/PilA